MNDKEIEYEGSALNLVDECAAKFKNSLLSCAEGIAKANGRNVVKDSDVRSALMVYQGA